MKAQHRRGGVLLNPIIQQARIMWPQSGAGQRLSKVVVPRGSPWQPGWQLRNRRSDPALFEKGGRRVCSAEWFTGNVMVDSVFLLLCCIF